KEKKGLTKTQTRKKIEDDDDSDLLGEDLMLNEKEEGNDFSDQRKRADDIMNHENRRMAVKRNLEGNSHIPKSKFSCLSSNEIIDVSKKMGVNMNNQNMESIDLLKEMELAQEILGSNKKSEALGKSRRVWMIITQIKLKGVAPLMRHMISQYNSSLLSLMNSNVSDHNPLIAYELKKLEENEESDPLNSE
ncbi:hypothetical protein ACJX0J_020842, partial [Zea mays]